MLAGPWRLDGAGERGPLLVVVDQRGDVAVPGPVGLAVRRHHAGVRRGPQGRAEERPVSVLDQHERGHRLEHGHLHLLALAGPLTVEQRHHGGVQGGQAGHLVRHDRADVAGLAGQLLLHRRQAALRLDDVVVGGQVRVRAAAAVAVAVGVDDRRVDRGHLGIAEPERGDRLGPHRVDEHVGPRHQRPQGVLAGAGAQVEHHAALAAVHVDEDAAHARLRRGRDVAGRVAGRRLDLDHVGAHVGHDLGAVGPHDHRRQVDHAHAGQRPWMLHITMITARPRRTMYGIRRSSAFPRSWPWGRRPRGPRRACRWRRRA